MNNRIVSHNKIPQPVMPGRVAKVPMIMQMEALECGAACLDMVLAYYGRYVPLSQLRKECGVSRDGSSLSAVISVANYYGLEVHTYRANTEFLKTEATFPCILFWNNNHFVVLDGYKRGYYYINNPGQGVVKYSETQFVKEYSGVCTVFKPTESFEAGGTKDSVVGYLKKNLVGGLPMLALVIITTLLITLVGIIQPVLPRFFIDYLIPGRVTSAWNRIFFSGVIILSVIQIVVLWTRSSYLLKMQGKMAIYSSTKFIWHILSLPMDFFSQRYASDIVTRGFSNENIATTIIMGYAPLVLDFASMLFYLVMMVAYSPLLTIIGIISVLLNIVSTYYISQKTFNLMRVQQKLESELGNVEVNGIQMIETIKSSGSENSYFQKWSGLFAESNDGMVRINAINAAYGAIPSLLTQFTSGLILCIGVGFVINGQWTIGAVSAFNAYLNNFTAPSSKLVSSIASFRTLSTEIERVKDVMEYGSDSVFDNSASKQPEVYSKLSGEIDIKNVTFGYNKFRNPLVRNFSISIHPGDSIALVGSSGSGKSTIAKLLTKLNTAWEGEILFDGIPIDEIDRNIFVSSIASVDQTITMFPDTIYNNITMWDKSIPEEVVVNAARDAEIYDDIMTCDNGLETYMIEGGKNFSGGQRQRIEIARALATEPSIIIMDEATSALDAETEYRIISRIRAKNVTTIMISHRLSTVRDSDLIVVLKNGEILDMGKHQELMDRCEYYSEMITNE